MPRSDWNRRDVLKTLSSVAIGLAESRQSHAAGAGQVKWSAGTARPKLLAPAGATDCHHHVYDARFPAAPNALLLPPDASVDDYRALQRRLGTSRSVIVQPSTYGTDNRCTLAALAALGRSSRAVAVVDDTVADAELKRLDGLGVRGIRFNLAQAGATTPAMIEPLAKRIAPFGWHLQLNAPAAVLFDLMPIFERVPVPLVFDHLAHVPPADGVTHPLYQKVRGLLDRGRTWIKLSGVYIESKSGPPTYSDSGAIARAYVAAAPERLVWGSDWPHPTEQTTKPDDAVLFDLLNDWAPGAALQQRILVSNPAALYGF